MHSHRLKRYTGFTLIEVLMALVLFSVGILGVIALVGRGPSFISNSEDATRASLLAGEMVTTMQNLNTVNPSTTVKSAWKQVVNGGTSSNLTLPSSNGSVTYVPSTTTAPAYSVITVSWQDPSRTSRDIYTTRVADQ